MMRNQVCLASQEVLRQVEGANVQRGGWLGGDAWYGSVVSAVEVYLRFGVHSTFIIKNNNGMFPMEPLHAVLKARFGSRPAGHWVVFRAEVAGVKLLAMAYAWSQRGVLYFLSTCGKTMPHPVKYLSHFEDNYGNVAYKEIDRPHIAHFLYDYLPLIDEHNKQRQSLLNLERCWLTKNCWFRLLTTIIGMSVVDMHRWDRNHRYTHTQGSLDDDSIKIRKFSDLICGYLLNVEVRVRASPRAVRGRSTGLLEDDALERIQAGDGSFTRALTVKQIAAGRSVGSSCVQNCWICRKYLTAGGNTSYKQTQWRCKECKMPLCKASRTGKAGRTLSCLQEHMESVHSDLQCGAVRTCASFPEALQVYLHPRRSNRR